MSRQIYKFPWIRHGIVSQISQDFTRHKTSSSFSSLQVSRKVSIDVDCLFCPPQKVFFLFLPKFLRRNHHAVFHRGFRRLSPSRKDIFQKKIYEIKISLWNHMFRTLIKIYHKFLIKKNIIMSSNSCQIQQNPHCNLQKNIMFLSKWMIFPTFTLFGTPKKNKKRLQKGGVWEFIFLVVSRYSEATAHRLSTSTAHHTTQFAKFLLVFFWCEKNKTVNKSEGLKWGFFELCVFEV